MSIMGHTSYLTNVTTPMNPWTQKQLLEELYRFWKGSNRELAGGSTNAVTAVVEKGFGQQIVISVSQLPATEDSLHNTAYFSDALEKIETMHTPEALFTKPVRNINGDLLVAALEGYLVFATAALQGLTYAQACAPFPARKMGNCYHAAQRKRVGDTTECNRGSVGLSPHTSICPQ
jgi:hypothetical protein